MHSFYSFVSPTLEHFANENCGYVLYVCLWIKVVAARIFFFFLLISKQHKSECKRGNRLSKRMAVLQCHYSSLSLMKKLQMILKKNKHIKRGAHTSCFVAIVFTLHTMSIFNEFNFLNLEQSAQSRFFFSLLFPSLFMCFINESSSCHRQASNLMTFFSPSHE